MNTSDFQIHKERSIKRGWLYVINHPGWDNADPCFAVAEGPTPEAIRGAIEDVINQHITQDIVSGFYYDFGVDIGVCGVWLSIENQANYAAYLKAIEMGVEAITIKVNSTVDDSPRYARISAADYPDFYMAAVAHIKNCVESGWRTKDSIDYTELAHIAETI